MKMGVRFAPALLALVAATTVLAGCGKSNVAKANQVFSVTGGFRSSSADFAVKLGVPAPGFTAVDVVTGQSVSLDQFAGKNVLLNFVNYGCSTSINEAVSAQLLAVRTLTQQRSDFIPVSVFCGCCPVQTLKQFAESNGLKWPWLLDADNSIITKYSDYVGQYGYPTLVFVDKDQIIRDASGPLSIAELGNRLDRIVPGATPGGAVQ